MSSEDTKSINSEPKTYTTEPVTLSFDDNGGQATNITVAENGQGKGTWLTRWKDNDESTDVNESVSLTVPAAVATKGDHTGSISWTLYNTPDGNEQEPLYDPNES